MLKVARTHAKLRPSSRILMAKLEELARSVDRNQCMLIRKDLLPSCIPALLPMAMNVEASTHQHLAPRSIHPLSSAQSPLLLSHCRPLDWSLNPPTVVFSRLTCLPILPMLRATYTGAGMLYLRHRATGGRSTLLHGNVPQP